MKRMYYAAAAALPALGAAALPAAGATAAAAPAHTHSHAVRVKTVSVHPLGVRPDSASGCNGDICIDVSGYSLWVGGVRESVYLKGRHCGDWYLTFDGGRVNSAYMCVQGQASLSYLVESYLPNKTKICVSAAGIPGKPCETVHD
jgi:hypothetical protein